MLVNTDCCTVVVWVALVVWHRKMQWLCSCSGCEEHCHAKSCVLRSWLSLSVSCETLKRDPNHNVTICTPLQVSISPAIVSQVTTQSQGRVKAALESNFFSLSNGSLSPGPSSPETPQNLLHSSLVAFESVRLWTWRCATDWSRPNREFSLNKFQRQFVNLGSISWLDIWSIFGQQLQYLSWLDRSHSYLWWRFASCVSSDCQQGHDATGWDDKTSEANRWTAQKTFVIKVPLMSSPQPGPHGAPEFPSLARGAGGDSRHLIEIWDHRYRSTYSPCNPTSLLLSLNQSLKFVFVSSILNFHFHQHLVESGAQTLQRLN